jgi:hypothetical protein
MKLIAFIGACGLLAACSTSPEITGSTWKHTEIADGAEQSRQLVIDNGQCKQVAIGAAPMPEYRPASTPTSYKITGESRSIGGPTREFSATVRPTRNMGESFSDGLADGMAIRRSLDARRAEHEIFRGCMYRLGWTDGS